MTQIVRALAGKIFSPILEIFPSSEEFLEDQKRLQGLRLMTSLPDDSPLEKVQRYEAHLSRQFYKVLQELQALQAARQSRRSPIP